MAVGRVSFGSGWVWLSADADGSLVITQEQGVVSDILDSYRTYAAMKASADSYGGINSKRVYLNPTSESTLYSGAFGLSDTTTVKAIAVIGETSSEVTSKVFTKEDDGLITS